MSGILLRAKNSTTNQPFSSSNLCSSAHRVPHCMILSLLASLSPPWQRQRRNQGGETLVLRWRRSHPRPSLSTLATNNMIQIFAILKVRVHSENYLTQTDLKHRNCKNATLQYIDPCSSNIVTVCHSFVIPSRTCSFWFEYGQPDLKRAASLICSCLSWHSSFAGMIESGGKLVTLWLRWLLFQDVRESKWLANNLGTSCWERDPSLSSQRLSLWQHTEWNLILQRIWQAEILLASVWVWTMDPQISFDKMSME